MNTVGEIGDAPQSMAFEKLPYAKARNLSRLNWVEVLRVPVGGLGYIIILRIPVNMLQLTKY
jgi:hypothetical protein